MQRRPTGITVIAILAIIWGFVTLGAGIGILVFPVPAIGPLMQIIANYYAALGVICALGGIAYFVVGWGLWSLRGWARVTAIVLCALGCVLNLVTGIALLVGVTIEGFRISLPGPGVLSLLWGLGQGLVVWYLTKPDIVSAFEVFSPPFPPVDPTVGPTVVPPPSPPPVFTAPVTAPSRPQPTEVYGVQPRPSAWLVARNGPHSGKNFGLKAGDTTVGRDTRRADIVLDTTTVSGEHARVRCEGGQFFLYDLASTNGTFINNRQIQKQMLRDGDVVRFGQAEFVFKSVS